MGFSTPKKPFNLAEFLSQKGTGRSRRTTWKRQSSATLEDEDQKTEAAPTPEDEEQ